MPDQSVPLDPAKTHAEAYAGSAAWIRTLVGVLRSPVLRIGFLLAMVALLAYTLVEQGPKFWSDIKDLPVWLIVLAFLANVGYVISCMLLWRAVLADLGSRLTVPKAWRVYFIGQLGKYIPGSIWPVLAQMELSADQGVPRERAAVSMLLSAEVVVCTGVAVGGVTLPFVIGGSPLRFPLGFLVAAAMMILLLPPVTKRLVDFVLRLLKRAPMEQGMSMRGFVEVTAWAAISWLFAAVMAYLLIGRFAGYGGEIFGAALAGYALSWVAGYVAIFAPAGGGVRELVLTAVLGTSSAHQAALTVALVSRAVSVVGDVLTAGVAVVMLGRRKIRALRAASSAPDALEFAEAEHPGLNGPAPSR